MSQALGEVCRRLVDVFLCQLFPEGLQGDFQLVSRLGLRLEFMVLFQHGVDVINYSIDKMMLVSFNLNEYPMPAGNVSVLAYDCKMGWS